MTHTTGGGTFYVGAVELANEDFTLSLGKDFTRSGEGVFDGGDEAGDRAFAGYIRYCLESCQAPVVSEPTLKVNREGNQLQLSWTSTGFTLQTSPTLSPATWKDIGNSSPTARPLNSTSANEFFRLIKP